MGLGDQLLATGMARGARDRGKRIAFGDGHRILWDKHSEEVFRYNPNVARPGSERARDIEWIHYFKGHRIYNRRVGDNWVWNRNFRAIPGEMFFDPREAVRGRRFDTGFVVIEPQSAQWKSVAANKDWGFDRFQDVADRLTKSGRRVVQFRNSKGALGLERVEQLPTASFRDALAILSNASLYIGGEGGLHHGAAAVGIPAVVIFGGFIPPAVTGYDTHTNLTGGFEACGSLKPCRHCRQAMLSISADEVFAAAQERLHG